MQFLWLEWVRLPERILGIIIKVCVCLGGEIMKFKSDVSFVPSRNPGFSL